MKKNGDTFYISIFFAEFCADSCAEFFADFTLNSTPIFTPSFSLPESRRGQNLKGDSSKRPRKKEI